MACDTTYLCFKSGDYSYFHRFLFELGSFISSKNYYLNTQLDEQSV